LIKELTREFEKCVITTKFDGVETVDDLANIFNDLKITTENEVNDYFELLEE